VPVEAQSYGRPVIAYGRGGALETVIGLPLSGNSQVATGIFFHEQTPEALSEAITAFEERLARAWKDRTEPVCFRGP
jgi:glycogen synthase